jgi:hypothetical protein
MTDWNEEELDKFIKENRDLILRGKPKEGHEIKFLTRLQLKARHYVDITPYLVKVGIITVVVFILSVYVWYSFLRVDESKSIIQNIIEQFR